MSASAAVATPCYFCASNDSVYDLMRRGIWHTMPLNPTLRPISPSTITLVRSDGVEVNATDVLVNKYVRLISDPTAHLSAYEGNLASVFIVEVDPKVLERTDVLKIKHISDGAFEHLKMIMVDPGSVRRVHVIAPGVEHKLRALTTGKGFSTPIATTPALFHSGGAGKEVAADLSFDFEIAMPPPPTPATAAAPAAQGSITICKGDLLRSRMQTLVNTVNCVGVMGKGIALAFKRQYPAMFQEYRAKCTRKEVTLGVSYCFRLVNGKIIVNFPTKGHWRENSKLAEVEAGLQHLLANYRQWGITSMAIPPLGCGNGNLSWDEVLPLMRRYLSQMNIPIEIYAPHEANAYGTGYQSQRTQATKRGAPKTAPKQPGSTKNARRS